MNVSSPPRLGTALAALLALGALLAPGARAQITQFPAAPTLTPTHPFTSLGNNGSNADGSGPQAGLIALGDGYLYGTTASAGAITSGNTTVAGSGTVFRVHPDGTGFTVLHTFGTADANGNFPDGQTPEASLLAPGDGYLYGTTSAGGANPDNSAGTGTVFKIRPDGTGFEVLHTFSAPDPSSLTNADGANPAAALISFNGVLAGTAQNGGANGFGTVFTVSTDGATFTDLHDFTGGGGANPTAALLAQADATGTVYLYGTTSTGGVNTNGTLFRWGSPNILTTLYSFTALDAATNTTNTDGANPNAPLIAVPDATGTVFFYGTASAGGTNGSGTVFRFRTDGTAANTVVAPLYSFTAATGNTDGMAPRAALVPGGDGLLYGTTSGGGANGSGTVFRLSPDGTTTPLQTYYSFNPTTNDGSSVLAPLLVFGDGFLYGTAQSGGVNDSGTVFQLTGPPVSHVLWNNPDGRTIFWDVSPDGTRTIAGNYQAFQDDASGNTGYRAIALSTGPDGVSHLLWNNPAGITYLWTVQADGSFTPFFYPAFSDDGTNGTIWRPVAVSTGGDNVTHILWKNPNGRTILWDVDAATGSFTVKGNYGPQFDGAGGTPFVPIAVASEPGGKSHILWNNSDHRTMLWNLDANAADPTSGTGSSTSTVYRVFEDDETASTIWAPRALSVGPDSVPHILWNNPNGHTILWNVTAPASPTGFTIVRNYQAYQDDADPRTAYTAVALATGLDNLSRFDWDSPAGNTYLWSVSNADGTFTPFFYPLATDDGTGNTIWHSVAVSTSVTPAPAVVP